MTSNGSWRESCSSAMTMTRSPFEELTSIFAPSMGRVAATGLVLDATRELGVSKDALDDLSVYGILKHLTRRDGVVGLVARAALRKRGRRTPTLSEMIRINSAPEPPASEPVRLPKTRSGMFERVASSETESVARTELEALLASAMPEDAARAVVDEYWSAHRLTGTHCTPSAALAILEQMSVAAGAIGVAATFGKASFHLRHARSSA